MNILLVLYEMFRKDFLTNHVQDRSICEEEEEEEEDEILSRVR